MSDAEQRLLCCRWNFCAENRAVSFLEFETDVEVNSIKIESAPSTSVFRTIYRQIHDALGQLTRACNKKKFGKLSDDG